MSTAFGRALRVLFVGMIYVAAYAVMQNVVAYGMGLWGMHLAFPATGKELLRAFDNSLMSNIYLCQLLAMIVSFILYTALNLLRERPLREDLQFHRLNASTVIPAVLLALGCRLAVSVYTVLSESVPSLSESLESAPDYSSSLMTTAGLLIFMLTIVLFGPIFEELLFRGFLQSELMRGFPPSAAIVIGALIFGASHILLFQTVFAFFVGLAMGWCYYITKNLYASMILHIVFNATTIVTAVVSFGSLWMLISASIGALVLIVLSCTWLYFRARRV